MPPRRKVILLNAPSPNDLQLVCELLNSQRPAGARLRELVEAWKKSGPNLHAMMREDPELDRTLRKACGVIYRPTASGRSDLELRIDPLAFENYGAVIKKFFHRRSPDEGQAAMRAEQDAIRLFLSLTLNPAWEKLGGPCGRCGNYYIKKRVSQKIYCSRRCGNAATAITRTGEQRKQDHERKLRQARTASRKWKRASGVAWKEFVSKETGFTTRWLTRAVNQRELQLR